MTNDDRTRSAQAGFFCVELHGLIGDLDSQAVLVAARLRALIDPEGMPGGTSLTRALQDKLKQLSVERRRAMDLLAKIGHQYPCRHEEP